MGSSPYGSKGGMEEIIVLWYLELWNSFGASQGIRESPGVIGISTFWELLFIFPREGWEVVYEAK